MTEDFLHFVWKFKRFRSADLKTTTGESITIISTGSHNHDGGPDFFDARVRIGETTWAGNVELHIRSSDWMKHGHHHDKAYDNVVLHVVFEDDITLKRNGHLIPTLELKGVIEPLVYQKYRSLQTNADWIPCQAHLPSVNELTLRSWLDRMATERLEEKTQTIHEALIASSNSWEEVFYQRLARHVGMKVNDEAFEMLAKSVPVHVLAKHKNNLAQIEALLFGQAGLLEDVFTDDYPKLLQKEYDHLRKLHRLTPMTSHTWQFMRMRPANFPTIRIAQLSALVHHATHLFSRVLESTALKQVRALLEAEPSTYWVDHYHFDTPTMKKAKALGDAAIDNIIINVIAPMVFVYGTHHAKPDLKERAMAWLQDLPAENNNIIRQWEQLTVRARSAFASQALLRLKKVYCAPKRCLECAIGNAILKPAAMVAS